MRQERVSGQAIHVGDEHGKTIMHKILYKYKRVVGMKNGGGLWLHRTISVRSD